MKTNTKLFGVGIVSFMIGIWASLLFLMNKALGIGFIILYVILFTYICPAILGEEK